MGSLGGRGIQGTSPSVQFAKIIDVTSTEALLVRKNADGGDLLTADTTNMQVHFGDASNIGSAANPLISLIDSAGSIDNGFYMVANDRMAITTGGTGHWLIDNFFLGGVGGGGPGFQNVLATATQVTVFPNSTDVNTGLGWAGADKLSLIAGAIEAIRITEVGNLISEIQLNGPVVNQTGINLMTFESATIYFENDAVFN